MSEISPLPTPRQPSAPKEAGTVPAFAPIQIPVKLHIVQNPIHGASRTQESMLEAIAQANDIWRQAGISLNVVNWCSPRVTDEAVQLAMPNSAEAAGARKPSCAGLTVLPDYEPKAVNLFLLKQISQVGANRTQPMSSFVGSRLGLLSESPRAFPIGKAIAMIVGQILGLKWSSDGPPEPLTTPSLPGTLLTDDDIATARTQAPVVLNALSLGGSAQRSDLKVILPPPEDTLEAALADLDALVGLQDIKSQLRSLANFLKVEGMRRDRGKGGESVGLHTVLTGNPGTGKTTTARLLGRILKAVGAVPIGHVVEVERSVLMGDTAKKTAQQVHDAVDQALGGVLFIDEASNLVLGATDFNGNMALVTLLKRMEENRDRLAVVLAGGEDEMLQFLSKSSGLQSRLRHHFHFPDYTVDELTTIFKTMSARRGFELSEGSERRLGELMQTAWKEREQVFDNARMVRNLFEGALERQADRLVHLPEVTDEMLVTLHSDDLPLRPPSRWKGVGEKSSWDPASILVTEPPRDDSLERVLAEVDSLIGLAAVKRQIHALADFFAVEKRRHDDGLSNNPMAMHMIFAGPPGTGKTTVARLMGRILKALGLLVRGQVLETDRSGLVGGFVGQTALKTNETINRALHGVLFVDEAYSLIESDSQSHNWGREAVNTLLKRMEDASERLCVVAAGYTEEMERFLASNPGIQSRFSHRLAFESYSPDELLQIFMRFCSARGFRLDDGVDARALKLLTRLWEKRDHSFGNGRMVRNLFERTLKVQATRLAGTEASGDALTLIAADDLPLDFVDATNNQRTIGFRQTGRERALLQELGEKEPHAQLEAWQQSIL